MNCRGTRIAGIKHDRQRCCDMVRTQQGEKGDIVHPRRLDIEDGNVERWPLLRALRRGSQGRGSVANSDNMMAVDLESQRGRVANRRVVVNEKYASHDKPSFRTGSR